MTISTRDFGGHGGLGDRRYRRYCAAFDRVQHCVREGYFLEAIALLDSLIWDRLSSRLGYLTGELIPINRNLGVICSQLVGDSGTGGCERESAFRHAIWQLKQWLTRRNDAVHATCKVFRVETTKDDFGAILRSHKKTAEDGIMYLRDFDTVDTESRAAVHKVPASFPSAFFPEQRGGARMPVWGEVES